jgi:hypothetical protein
MTQSSRSLLIATHLDLGREIDDVFGASIQLGVSLLPPEALDLGHGDPLYADSRQGLADLVELERLDDRSYQFHADSLSMGRAPT